MVYFSEQVMAEVSNLFASYGTSCDWSDPAFMLFAQNTVNDYIANETFSAGCTFIVFAVIITMGVFALIDEYDDCRGIFGHMLVIILIGVIILCIAIDVESVRYIRDLHNNPNEYIVKAFERLLMR